ncbi:E3 ubiquitin-protein ligase DTX3L [Hemicordylus capensis]|uniref:E3 ubiquitin-protein ligase DTX3L n=1 Tax=Hemicordylus capensis TaxID=884348 RepID=UPI00230294AB|nr:E3 ubiquitin-protein ligase DTX3L [Hemicordylus capensis]
MALWSPQESTPTRLHNFIFLAVREWSPSQPQNGCVWEGQQAALDAEQGARARRPGGGGGGGGVSRFYLSFPRIESESSPFASEVLDMAGLLPQLLVQVSPVDKFVEKLEMKLELYFQSQRRSGGGECDVETQDRERGVYRVQFQSEEVKNRVKAQEHHFIEINDTTLKISILPDSEKMDTAEGSSTNDLINLTGSPLPPSRTPGHQNSFDEQKPREKYASLHESISKKIFLQVSATLNTDLLPKEEREQVTTLFPTLKIDKASSKLGIEKVTGDYIDIEKLHHYFESYLGYFQRSSRFSHHKRENGLEEMNVEEDGGKGRENVQDREFDMEVPSAVFEYFGHTCQEKIEELWQKFNVKLMSKERGDGLTSIRFTADGNPRFIEKAQQIFVTDFQKVAADLKQETVSFPDHQQCTKALEMLNTKSKSVLVKRNKNELILRGPSREIADAKEFMEEMREGNIIKSAVHSVKNGIEVVTNVFEVLEPKLAKEIEAINKKYDTAIDIKPSLNRQTARILFKPKKNKHSDGPSQAYERFCGAYQKALTERIERVLPLDSSKEQKIRLDAFFPNLEKENPRIRFERKNNKLILFGLPNEVCAAEQHIRKFLNFGAQTLPSSVQAVHMSSFGATSEISPGQNQDRKMFGFASQELPDAKAIGVKQEEEEEEKCSICMDRIQQKEVLPKCKHEFCKMCIRAAMEYKPACPVCNMFYGQIEGNQPPGTMKTVRDSSPLPGYEGYNTITIEYVIPGGIQTKSHPNPGRSFYGTRRTAYLPDSSEGREVLKLLQQAFHQKLIFTVGQSRTTGVNDVITWNDIHHKTSKFGGPDNFGYPDPHYLKRVREELKAKGIE